MGRKALKKLDLHSNCITCKKLADLEPLSKSIFNKTAMPAEWVSEEGPVPHINHHLAPSTGSFTPSPSLSHASILFSALDMMQCGFTESNANGYPHSLRSDILVWVPLMISVQLWGHFFLISSPLQQSSHTFPAPPENHGRWHFGLQQNEGGRAIMYHWFNSLIWQKF